MADETWLMPHTVEDPSDDWVNEEDTLRDSMTSQAERDDLPSGTWTGYLVWSYAPASQNLLNIGFYIPTSNWYYEVDLYDGEHWRNVSAGPGRGIGSPAEFAFPLRRVEKIRLRLGHSDTGLKDVDAFRAKLALACVGPLAPLCGIFHTIGDFFADLADQIDDVMFVGDALAAPFVFLAGTFHDAGDTCCQISAALGDLLDALEGGLTAEEIIALLEEHWPAMAALLADPVAYISTIVEGLILQLYAWLSDPVAFIIEIVDPLIPDLPGWFDDAESWLATMLLEHFPALYALWQDPVGWFLVQLTLAFDLNPWNTRSLEALAKWVLEEYFFSLYEIWRDPEGWIASRLSSAIESLREMLLEALGALGEQIGELLDFLSDPLSWAWSWIGQWIEGALISDEDWEAEKGTFSMEAMLAEIDEVWPDVKDWAMLFLADQWDEDVDQAVEYDIFLPLPSPPRKAWIEAYITGVVTEENSPAIAGARVAVIGSDLSAITGFDGRFTIEGRLPAAPSYTLVITKPGYTDKIVPGVIVIDGVETSVALVMGYVVLPPRTNPGPRLLRAIADYPVYAAKLAWSRTVLADRIGEETEDFWQAQVDYLAEGLDNLCGSILASQAQLLLYYGDAEMPDEYAAALDFQCSWSG